MAKCKQCGKPALFAMELCQECTDAAMGVPATPSIPAPKDKPKSSADNQETWKCRNCGEAVEASFGTCWNCQTERAARGPQHDSAPGSPGTGDLQPNDLGEQLEARYRDGYRVARVTIFFGGIAKAVGVLFGCAAILFAVAVFKRSETLALTGCCAGIVVGLLLYAIGVMVAAHGQLLLTSIDGAINTSPFLTDKERAAIMRIALVEGGE